MVKSDQGAMLSRRAIYVHAQCAALLTICKKRSDPLQASTCRKWKLNANHVVLAGANANVPAGCSLTLRWREAPYDGPGPLAG